MTASFADSRIAAIRRSESLKAWAISVRSVMSRMMPEKKRAAPSSAIQVARESSMGNSVPSARRPWTSTVWPVIRVSPVSTTLAIPDSCASRNRGGTIFVSDWPIMSSSVCPNMRSAAGFHVTTNPSESAVTMASVADVTIASSLLVAFPPFSELTA